jgi:hypothetical protein
MATSKTLGIFIATPGRSSIWRTLHSIAYQRANVEDVLVVGDGYHEATDKLIEIARDALNIPVRYVATTKTRDFGHTQQNYALKHVRGDYLLYQDDDDIFLPRALGECVKLVSELETPRPLLGRIKAPRFGLLWQQAGDSAVLDGHCIVVPNDKRKLGWFNNTYNGDQCYLHTCLRNYKEVAWTDRIWTLARPHWTLWPGTAVRGGNVWACDFYRDDCGVHGAEVIANVSLVADAECDLFHTTINTRVPCTVQEYQEIAEFLVYAGQSKDIWIKVHPSEVDLLRALKACNFTEHQEYKDSIELTHSWPPDFWEPSPPFNKLMDGDGNLLPDWRDPIWGGTAVDDE